MPLPFAVPSQSLAARATARTPQMDEAVNYLNELHRSVSRLYVTTQQLKHTHSDDPLQQLQTDAIVEIFKSLSWIQRTLWPTVEQLIIPTGIEAVKEAAGGGGGGGGGAAAAVKVGLARTAALRRF